MKIIEVFLFQLANFIVFVGLRYMSAIAAIMAGIDPLIIIRNMDDLFICHRLL